MLRIPRSSFDAFAGGGRRPVAVLLSFPDEDDPDVTVRGVTVLHRAGGDVHVAAKILVLEDGEYVEQGGAGAVVDVDDFVPWLTYEATPRPVDEDETEWLVPRIETSIGPGGAVASRVVARPTTDPDRESPA